MPNINQFDIDLHDAASGLATDILDDNAFGSKWLYVNRGAAQGVLVQCRAEGSAKHITTMLANRVETTERIFTVPAQPEALGPQGVGGPVGFPPVDGISEFDTMQQWDGTQGIGPIFFVNNSAWDSVEAVYKLSNVRWQVTKIGVE